MRAALVAELIAVRDTVVGPGGSDPVLSAPVAVRDDAVELCAAVYALPAQFRDRGRSGTPLLWPWPWDLFRGGLSRREELLLGAALMLLAAERLDRRAAPGGEQRLQSVPAGRVVGQK